MDIRQNQKYRQLMDAARDLFIRFGLKRVTIEEICKTANVSKMTFYKFFKNKTEIVNAVYKEMIDRGWSEYREIMKKGVPFSDKLRMILEMKARMRSEAGVPFLHDLLEDREYYPLVQQKIEESREENIKFIKTGMRSGDFRKDLNIEFCLYQLDNIMVMLEEERLKYIYPDIESRLDELTKFFFFGLGKISR